MAGWKSSRSKLSCIFYFIPYLQHNLIAAEGGGEKKSENSTSGLYFSLTNSIFNPYVFKKKTACGGLETLFIQRITIRFFQGMLFLLINSLFGYFSGNAVSINKLVFASGPIPGESVRSETRQYYSISNGLTTPTHPAGRVRVSGPILGRVSR